MFERQRDTSAVCTPVQSEVRTDGEKVYTDQFMRNTRHFI